MEILQLKYFCDAAACENFSETAKRYFVPTSNISQSIKRLEIELGCQLFERKANRVILNKEGKSFYLNISKAIELIENEKIRICNLNNVLCGEIRLICLSNRRRVADTIETFIKKYPGVSFIIRHTFDADLAFDVLISDTCPYEYSEKILIFDEDICIAVNKEHPFAQKESLTVSDLENERFISMTKGSSLHRITTSTCAEHGFIPNIAIQTEDPFYLRKYVEMGLGIAFVPASSWGGLFSNNIVLKNIDHIKRKTYVFLPKTTPVKHSVEVFLQTLQSQSNSPK